MSNEMNGKSTTEITQLTEEQAAEVTGAGFGMLKLMPQLIQWDKGKLGHLPQLIQWDKGKLGHLPQLIQWSKPRF